MSRTCSMTLCPADAHHTLTYDYESHVAAIGPLSPEPSPNGHDLCLAHSERWTPPVGWSVIRFHRDFEER